MMRRSRCCWTAAAIVVLGAACGDDTPPTMGGAALLAAGEDTEWSEVREVLSADDEGAVVRLDEVRLDHAAMLLPGPDPEDVVLLLEQPDDSGDRVTASIRDGEIRELVPADISVFSLQTAVDVTASGVMANASDGDLGRAFSGDPSPAGEVAEQPLVRVVDPGFVPRAEYPSPFPVGAVAVGEDGAVVLGGLYEGRIAGIAVDGTTTHLLGPAGSGAVVEFETDPGPVIAVLALDDGRVAFVAGVEGDTRLYSLDGSEVRQVPGGGEASPVAGTDERRAPVFENSFPRPAITPLAPSPDGRVLTTGVGPDGDPRIALVDIDSGDAEVLSALEGVEPTIDEPVSAVIVGSDLVFLAQHQLWRLPDAVAP